jgi:thiamine-phosphate pyrophosphorylase
LNQVEALRRASLTLRPRTAGAKGLPRLLAFTDPDRSGDVLRLAAGLPRGSALVFRTFGAADALETARRLRRITWRRGVLLLIGADTNLARAVRADGVHLPERFVGRLPALTRRGLLLTAAAHSPAAARRALALGANAVVLSSVMPSVSPSAGRAIGPLRLAQIVRALGGPAYALGGINAGNSRRVAATGIAGLAAVGAFIRP